MPTSDADATGEQSASTDAIMPAMDEVDVYATTRLMQEKNASLRTKLANQFGATFFNMIITHLPSHLLRQGVLRLLGAKIGKDTSILRGTTILGVTNLVVGEACSIGFRCMLDARGGLTIGDCVVIASDTHIIGGYHDHNDPTFPPIVEPTVIGDYVWIASRSTILSGVTIERGAVVGGCSVVRRDVGELDVVAGVPARVLAKRNPDALQYRPVFRPLFD